MAAPPMIINSRVDGAARQARVDRFQVGPDEFDVMILSPRAGGVGLTLTHANHVIHLSRWWNPAVEDQATDRAHRIGQTRVVTSYKLITRGTVEEKILTLQQRKREVIAATLDGTTNNSPIQIDGQLAGASDGLRINAKGELVDYWGTPFFFHQLSGTQMEIHSAGPDRQMWTGDDIVIK